MRFMKVTVNLIIIMQDAKNSGLNMRFLPLSSAFINVNITSATFYQINMHNNYLSFIACEKKSVNFKPSVVE